MSTYVFSINKSQKPKDILDFLDKTKPKKGDKVKLVSDNDMFFGVMAIAGIALFAIALAYYFKKKQHEEAEKMLQSLFEYYSTEEYEKYIEKEYGIIVEIEEKNGDDDNWYKLSMQSLNKAYSVKEPDICHIKLNHNGS